MRIAVALCTYNGEAHLREQLRSIATQSRLPDALVVTDDASDDETMAILEDELRDAPFVVDCERNATTLGITANFARTLSRCDADVVVLADQDDVWAHRRIEVGCAPFASDAVTATFSNAALIDDRGQARPSSLWAAHGIDERAQQRLVRGGAWPQLLRWNCVTGATLAIRRDVLDTALPIPSDTLHDEWLGLVSAGLGEVVAIAEPLVSYRVHSGSALGLPPRRWKPLTNQRKNDVRTRSHEADRFAELAGRLAVAGARERGAEAARKAALSERRAALSTELTQRVAPVVSALAKGRYHRFAHGLRSAAHDLVFGA